MAGRSLFKAILLYIVGSRTARETMSQKSTTKEAELNTHFPVSTSQIAQNTLSCCHCFMFTDLTNPRQYRHLFSLSPPTDLSSLSLSRKMSCTRSRQMSLQTSGKEFHLLIFRDCPHLSRSFEQKYIVEKDDISSQIKGYDLGVMAYVS